MPCYNPVQVWRPRLKGGGFGPICFDRPAPGEEGLSLMLPCRGCIGCRLDKQRDWQTRLLHESKSHKENSFITLTYDDEHLPEDECLHYEDYQYFMRKLRKAYKPKKVRFFVSGEYGQDGRPHWHALLFGLWFEDAKKVNSHSTFFESKILSLLWGKGFVTIGEVNSKTTRYVSKYLIKRITGEIADEFYTHTTRFGEVVRRPTEFSRMSLKPGIGGYWYSRFKDDWFPRDHCIVDGKKQPVPAYYLRRLRRDNRFMHDEVKIGREINSDDPRAVKERTPERLRVREKVANATVKLRSKGKI